MPLTLSRARDLVAKPAGMSEVEARGLLDLLMGATLPVEDGGALLAALAARGETGAEVAAFVRGLLERATVFPDPGACLDLCGTGGSGLARFNVSTTAAFVLAGVGVRVAKHGNRGSLRPNGSFDLLDALGVPFLLAPDAHVSLLDRTRCCFLFARAMHPAVAAVAPYRKAAGRRTIFNLAGPLANPCRPVRQIIGVSSWPTARVVAMALQILAVERALVVWGEPGIDEVSVSGATRWLEVDAKGVVEGGWRASDPSAYADIPAGDAADNAETFRALIAGGGPPALRAMVAANAAVALDLWRGLPILGDGSSLREAEEAMRSGEAQRAFTGHRDAARSMAAAAST